MKKRCKIVDDGRRVIFDPPLTNNETVIIKADVEALKITKIKIKKESA